MAHHQKRYKAFQVLSYGSPSCFISPLASSPPIDLGLDFGIRSFEYLPFGFSLVAFVHTHPIHSSTRGVICLISINHLTHDLLDFAAWHLLLLFDKCCLFLPLRGDHLNIKKLGCAFDDSFMVIG